VLFDKLRDWFESVEKGEDPEIRDARLYDELIAAITKETPSGKKKCDHPKKGSLDGVICAGIATYILQESPDAFECRVLEDREEQESGGLLARLLQGRQQTGDQNRGHRGMGAGLASAHERLF
jgi:hypothetical protein